MTACGIIHEERNASKEGAAVLAWSIKYALENTARKFEPVQFLQNAIDFYQIKIYKNSII